MNKLDRLTKRFDTAYQRRNKYENQLKERQVEMFQAFTKDITGTALARKSVQHPEGLDGIEVLHWIKTNHPGWRFLSSPSAGSTYIVLEEDPTVKKFTWINHATGRVYGRTYAEGSPTLDDDRLKRDDPDLWERVSSWSEPWWSLVRGAIKSQTSMPWSDAALDAATDGYLREQDVQRVVKDPATLSDTELSALQPYLSPGKLTVRLVPPRDAKPEELEDLGYDND